MKKTAVLCAWMLASASALAGYECPDSSGKRIYKDTKIHPNCEEVDRQEVVFHLNCHLRTVDASPSVSISPDERAAYAIVLKKTVFLKTGSSTFFALLYRASGEYRASIFDPVVTEVDVQWGATEEEKNSRSNGAIALDALNINRVSGTMKLLWAGKAADGSAFFHAESGDCQSVKDMRKF